MSANSGLNYPGIYTITCTPSGRTYVGQARNIRRRWSFHRWRLIRQEHDNAHLQNAWNKYGPDAFEFAVVVDMRSVPKDELFDALNAQELAILATVSDRFNLTEAAIGTYRYSDETRAKLSAERKTRWADQEYRDRAVASMRVKAADPDFQARRGAAISIGHSTPARKAKASFDSRLRWADPDFRAERGAEREANWRDPEYRAQQSASRKATWDDPEVRARRVAGLKAAWIKRRERAQKP